MILSFARVNDRSSSIATPVRTPKSHPLLDEQFIISHPLNPAKAEPFFLAKSYKLYTKRSFCEQFWALGMSRYVQKPENPRLVVRRGLNAEYRSREYLTLDEVELLLIAADCRGRHPVRDRTLLLLMFRHGLRASEAAMLRWDAVLWEEPSLMISRLKGSEGGAHPLQEDELEALQGLRAEYPGARFLFVSERGGVLSRLAIHRIVQRCGVLAKLPLPVHPHMLRHSCGYYLANQGVDTRLIQDWLGHSNIQHTVRYTKLNPARFREIRWG